MRKVIVFSFLFSLLFVSIYLCQQVLVTFVISNHNSEAVSARKIYFYHKSNMTLIGKMLLEDVFKDNCTNDYVFSDEKVHVVLLADSTVVSTKAYKAIKTKEFIDSTANPFEKSNVSVTLDPYEDKVRYYIIKVDLSSTTQRCSTFS